MSGKRADTTPKFVTELNPYDVLMGRGSPSAEYEGNLLFRKLVTQRREDYLKCTRRLEKHKISQEIIEEIHGRGRRFLVGITTAAEAELFGVPPRTQAWKVVETSKQLLVKVKQLMRDVGPETQEKRKIRRSEKRTALKTQVKEATPSGGGVSPRKSSSVPTAISYEQTKQTSQDRSKQLEELSLWERDSQNSQSDHPQPQLGKSEVTVTPTWPTQGVQTSLQQMSSQSPHDMATLLEMLLQNQIQSSHNHGAQVSHPWTNGEVQQHPADALLAPLLAELVTKLSPAPPPPLPPVLSSTLDLNTLLLYPQVLQAIGMLSQALNQNGR